MKPKWKGIKGINNIEYHKDGSMTVYKYYKIGSGKKISNEERLAAISNMVVTPGLTINIPFQEPMLRTGVLNKLPKSATTDNTSND